MAKTGSVLGTIGVAATSLYVADLDAAIRWYEGVLDLKTSTVGADGDRHAVFELGGALIVLEPIEAAIEPVRPGAENATVNLVVDLDPADVRTELLRRGVRCSEIVDSRGYRSFLIRDPDGNRFYVAQARTNQEHAWS